MKKLNKIQQQRFDMFASAALTGLMCAVFQTDGAQVLFDTMAKSCGRSPEDHAAYICNRYADAMLKARPR